MTLHSAPSFGKATPILSMSTRFFSGLRALDLPLWGQPQSSLLSLGPQGHHPETHLFWGHLTLLALSGRKMTLHTKGEIST